MHSKSTAKGAFLLLAAMIATTMFLVPMPASAIYAPPYEHFGPRVDNLLIKMYASETAEFEAFLAGDIDVIDWPLTEYYITQIETEYADEIQMDTCDRGVKAHRIYYGTWPGEEAYADLAWEGFVNELEFGYNSWWSFLNVHPEGYEAGAPDATVRYGFKTLEVQMLNPIYSSSYWDWEILDKCYGSFVKLDPYDKSFGGDIAWMAENWWAPGLWWGPGGYASMQTFRMRDDIYFSDGEHATVDDVIWTWQTMPNRLINNGCPPPWWYATIADIFSIEVYGDPWRFRVNLEHLNHSYLHSISTMLILPKHVWEPLVPETMTEQQKIDIQAFQPDPDLTGSGPWKFVEYLPTAYVKLTANKPASQGYFSFNPEEIMVMPNADSSGILVWDFNKHAQSLWTRKRVTIDGWLADDKHEIEPKSGSGSIYGTKVEEFAVLTTHLYVDSLGAEHPGWIREGLSPYLDAADHPADYVHTSISNDSIGDFGFQDLSGDIYVIPLVRLSILCSRPTGSDDYFEAYLYDGISWSWACPVSPSSLGLSWSDVWVIGFLDTKAKVNATQMYLKKITVGEPEEITVDAARLEVYFMPAFGIHTVTVEKLVPTEPMPPTCDRDLPPQWQVTKTFQWEFGVSASFAPVRLRGDIDLDGSVGLFDAIHMVYNFGVDYAANSRVEGYPMFPEFWIVMRCCSVHATDLDEINIDDANYIVYNYGKTTW